MTAMTAGEHSSSRRVRGPRIWARSEGVEARHLASTIAAGWLVDQPDVDVLAAAGLAAVDRDQILARLERRPAAGVNGNARSRSCNPLAVAARTPLM